MKPRFKRIGVPIIHERGWYVLTRLVRHGVTADCYRLMKIGDALGYRSLKERGGKLLIEEGIEAWATYVRTQRAFLVSWATQEALALCRGLGVQEPELSSEVKRLVEVPAAPL